MTVFVAARAWVLSGYSFSASGRHTFTTSLSINCKRQVAGVNRIGPFLPPKFPPSCVCSYAIRDFLVYFNTISLEGASVSQFPAHQLLFSANRSSFSAELFSVFCFRPGRFQPVVVRSAPALHLQLISR
jgi:hypothetical protein